MKKSAYYIVLGTAAACFLTFASCKSTKKADTGAEAATGGLEVSASEETDNNVLKICHLFTKKSERYTAKVSVFSNPCRF